MNKTLARLILLLAVLHTVAFLLVYPSLPNILPISYGLRGEINGWGSRAEYIALQLAPLLTAIGFQVLPRVDPRGKNHRKNPRTYDIIMSTTVGTLLLLCWGMLAPALGFDLPVSKVIMGIMGITFIILGNYMPQVHSNFFVGVKTPWTLSSDRVWRKTHRLAGVLFCLGGICMVLSVLLFPAVLSVVACVLILGGALGSVIYSYILYRRERADREEKHHAED